MSKGAARLYEYTINQILDVMAKLLAKSDEVECQIWMRSMQLVDFTKLQKDKSEQ